ncbi:PREDICTED: protein transport protein Sec61 subunit alpha isoform X1 [Theobroma cacao]|uniref:Protein transport protein Sec61 subunit alpha isoform X1 n=1 Tax=Theobroma cacao TaxID=3641 RepID=A0AB32WNR3_THECC|nr:PREDICTED: protein transport protein Sec61 subunit alpha isoform X1 [Theobroma cacao]XP_017980405.1 PREDICTED: protein transport protein Sec61 subunit alpha isoform X1 [Theobroma cacao]XP_017980406.1 PREDICTED: protein transport protein Sec61 subunit alpha isoform X1 [Theobroma cacao]XP_017980407.1 PREDICTED: protein transport protein Sec61 subunit alpha isoform X1 [Theobroma cacao]
MHIILHSALVSNLYMISQLLYRRYGGNIFVNLLGQWEESEYSNGQSILVVALHITSLLHQDMAAHPFHALFYLVFMLSACALFSKTWIEVLGSSARDVDKQLREQQMVMPGRAEPLRTHCSCIGRHVHWCSYSIGRLIAWENICIEGSHNLFDENERKRIYAGMSV